MTDAFVGRKVLGRYRIVRSIGRGGMGLIYLARQEGAAAFVKPVVVKRATPDLLAQQPALREFMGREARIMSHLQHPAIVSVLDFAEEDGAYLLVLDYVHGYHLGQWARFLRKTGRPLAVDLAIHVVCKVLDALHYAHTVTDPDGKPLGIVHRDVSPGNVLLDLGGTLKLADFGIARMHSDHTETNTHERLLKGKLSYMAPELLSLHAPTPQTDLYAAAVVLHELLAGKNELHVSGSLETTVGLIFQHVPTAISEIRPDAPKALDAVLARGLAKAPADRYADAAELARDLRQIRGGTDDEVGKRLAALIGEDFRNPRMSEALGHDLAVLDRAWRDAPSQPDLSAARSSPEETETLLGSSESVSRALGPVEKGSVPRPRAGRAWLWTSLAGVAVAAAAAGYWMLLRADRPPPVAPNVIVLGGQVSGTDGLEFEAGVATTPGVGSGSAVAASATQTPGATAAPPTTTPSAPSTPPAVSQVTPQASHQGSVEALTRAFARREPQVAQCFDTNASDVRGAPEIAIRFGIDAQGRVTQAQVLPPQVAGTTLGSCLADVARGTQFGPQAQAVSFRIPIVARRGP